MREKLKELKDDKGSDDESYNDEVVELKNESKKTRE